MLFQPSNVLPDVINGTGNGTVDVTQGLSVSWQINGNSPMTKYAIYIYQNNASSQEKMHTSVVSSSPLLPASGVDFQGNTQRFQAATSSASSLSAAGITNGNEYKLKIIQYYTGANGSDATIEQRSMSVFKTRALPTLSITPVANNIISAREATFNGTYSQAQGDALTWVRWQLYNNTGENDSASTYETNLLYDTGQMYGVTTLRFEYDSFLNHGNYNLVLTIETTSGIRKTTSYQFITEWATSVLNDMGEVSACKLNKQSTAVQVSWYTRYIGGKS